MSDCQLPSLTLPNPPDLLGAIVAALQALGISIPPLPTIPAPPAFCPLD
jgi:hypothetical protein